jgi:hypothetical protein
MVTPITGCLKITFKTVLINLLTIEGERGRYHRGKFLTTRGESPLTALNNGGIGCPYGEFN